MLVELVSWDDEGGVIAPRSHLEKGSVAGVVSRCSFASVGWQDYLMYAMRDGTEGSLVHCARYPSIFCSA